MSDAINAARAALLLIWPRGAESEHTHARTAFHALDAAEKREAELVEALSAMCHQYLRVEHGKLHHDFMSAGEAAFDALGWPDDGQPLDASCLCEVPGCGEGWCAGSNGKDGKYHTFCSKHYKEWREAGNEETPEQADERWVANMVKLGDTEHQARAQLAANKAQQAEWIRLREKMPEPEAPLPQKPQKTAAEMADSLALYIIESVLTGDGEQTSQVEGKA